MKIVLKGTGLLRQSLNALPQKLAAAIDDAARAAVAPMVPERKTRVPIDHVEFDEPIFGRAFHLLLTADTRALDAVIRKRYPGSTMPPDIDDRSDGAYWSISGPKSQHCIIWIRYWRGTVSDYGTLVHEITHATMSVCERLNISTLRRDDETFCYYMEWLTEKCLLHLRAFKASAKNSSTKGATDRRWLKNPTRSERSSKSTSRRTRKRKRGPTS